MLHSVQRFSYSAYKLNKQISRVTIYSLDILLSRFGTSLLFHVQLYAGQVVWYSHLFKNFPQFVVIHTVKGFGIVNKAEVDAFLKLFCIFNDPTDVGNLISGSSGV